MIEKATERFNTSLVGEHVDLLKPLTPTDIIIYFLKPGKAKFSQSIHHKVYVVARL